VNLFSLNWALKNGFTLRNKDLSICLSKGQVSVIFDRVLRTTNGFVSGVKLSVFPSPVIYNATTMIRQDKRINVNKFHEMMGHCGTEKLQKTANILGCKLINCWNKAFHHECVSKGLNIKFEFSGPQTPQQNGKVEKKFQTFYGRIRAMLNCAGLKDTLRSSVWAECARTVTFLSNITSAKNKEVCPHQLMFGSIPKLSESLRLFGEIGVVTAKNDIQGKLQNRGTFCMFVGYSIHHANDVYRMLNLETDYIINLRDIKWIKMYHKDWIRQKDQVPHYLSDDEDGSMIFHKSKERNVPESEVSSTPQNVKDTTTVQLYCQMKQLESSFNPEASKIIDDLEQGREILLDQVNLALFGVNFEDEPRTSDEAWNCKDPINREKWRMAIKKEFTDMESRDVWDVIRKEDVSSDRRCIKCKWIIKFKQNGVFRARLVACGYSQVPGVDFNESYAPVINYVSF
jgi:Reverse transcriptase (RNA-dependent DNA polymerase)